MGVRADLLRQELGVRRALESQRHKKCESSAAVQKGKASEGLVVAKSPSWP